MTSRRIRTLVSFLSLCLILPTLLSGSAAADSKRLGYYRLTLVARLAAIDKTARIAKARIALTVPEVEFKPDAPVEIELTKLSGEAAPGDFLTAFESKYDGVVWVRSPIGDAAACTELLKSDDLNGPPEILRKYLDHLGHETACGDIVFLRLRQRSLREVFDLKAEEFLDTACRRVLEVHDPELSKFYFFLIAGCGDKGKRFLTETPALFESTESAPTAFRSARIAVLGQQEITSIVDSILAPRSQIRLPYPHYLAIHAHIPLGFVPRDVVLSEIARFATNEELSDLAMSDLKNEKHWTACDLILRAMKSTSRTRAGERAAIRFLRAMQQANGGEPPEEKVRLAQAKRGLEEMKRRSPESYEEVEEGERLKAEFEREQQGQSK